MACGIFSSCLMTGRSARDVRSLQPQSPVNTKPRSALYSSDLTARSGHVSRAGYHTWLSCREHQRGWLQRRSRKRRRFAMSGSSPNVALAIASGVLNTVANGTVSIDQTGQRWQNWQRWPRCRRGSAQKKFSFIAAGLFLWSLTFLMVPYIWTFAELGRSVLIAWDSSREAVRAANHDRSLPSPAWHVVDHPARSPGL